MNKRFAVGLIVVGVLFIVAVESKNVDPYKVLGVDKSATQREIQKAFHKLSLQYHPDKNKKKGAEAKFAEINNAYDILSDEQKRKNYDLYGDEKGNPGFDAGNPGDHGGYTHFTSGGPGQSGWQNMGGQGSSKSFSFSFGGPGSGKENSFGGFDLNDMFSSFFGGGMGGGSQSGGFGGFGGSKQGKSKGSTQSLQLVNAKLFRNEIADKGVTWLLCFHISNVQGIQSYESVMEEVANSLQGTLKAGSINCQSDASLCKELGVHLRRSPKIFVYSYASSESGSLLEYAGDLEAKSLKSFCQDNLPRFSRRVNLENFNGASKAEKLPRVLLLSTKKSTPVIWRALSGLYRKRILFYDAQVEASDPCVKKLGADSVPSIIGWLSNGEKEVLKSGISVKDLKSAIQELSGLIDNFERRNKKAASAKRDQTESGDLNKIPLLTSSNFHEICVENVPVCFIAAFKSSKTKDKLQAILRSVSQKSFLRQPSWASGARDSVSYALLDSAKQQSFLKALDKSGFKSSENLLVAYKSKKGTHAVLQGEITEETLERFISSVLNGEVQFIKTRQRPILK